MNKITLNGVESTSITGLLIQSLPPISKPKRRTQIEEIDGRDGDLVTVLGYAAYDKKVKIGLHGSFNIDTVISFFDSSGDVVFSNEDGKFYRYAIYNAIDYDRLIRFREAEVAFHVQPFKYALSEQTPTVVSIVSQESLTLTNNGNIFSKPILSVTGSGTVLLFLNGNQAFTLSLGTDETITIDSEAMEATNGGVLANRSVTGDYENIWLPVGANTLTWTGTVTEISYQYPSRWI